MRLEAIKLEQQKILKELYRFKDFYLVGGTGLALQIGHRVSIDFDLFTEKGLPSNLLSQVKKTFPKAKIAIVLKRPEQFSVTVDGIKIDFVKEQPLLLDPIVFQNLKIANVAEIAAMKAHTLGFRGKLKDYVDLYF
ncbi:MAG: nucleotidyl transferase AbiEii/AbiGii toxin family protein, partial [Patescibacteria group bacterium]